uniref:Uncharacterized protein n=1 Tax=viral metagenome TaxID=1070528 RepID=A0A6C0K0E7_9ZZZZ
MSISDCFPLLPYRHLVLQVDGCSFGPKHCFFWMASKNKTF